METQNNPRKISKVYPLVYEFVTCFEQDANATEAYNHTEFFHTGNLCDDAYYAIEYAAKRLKNPPQSYFLPVCSLQDFVMGKNAAFSVHITLAIEYMDGSEDEVPFMGWYEEEECEEGVELLWELIEEGY